MREDLRAFAPPNDQGIDRSENIRVPTLTQYKKSFKREMGVDPLLIRDRQGRGHPMHFLDSNTFIRVSSGTRAEIIGALERVDGLDTSSKREPPGKNLAGEEGYGFKYRGMKFSLTFPQQPKGDTLRLMQYPDGVQVELVRPDRPPKTARVPFEEVHSTGTLVIIDSPKVMFNVDELMSTYQSARNRRRFQLSHLLEVSGVDGKDIEIPKGAFVSPAEIFDLFSRSDVAHFYLERLASTAEGAKCTLDIMEAMKQAGIPFFGWCKDRGSILVRER